MRGYRVGIVGPRTPFGQSVRDRLSQGELAVTDLKLFESDVSGEASLSQFGDEVVVTQPIDPDLFPHLDVIFFGGGDSDLMNRMARKASEEGVLTLVEGAVGLGAPVVTPRDFGALASGGGGLGTVPRAASYLLGQTLAAMASSYTIERAVATILIPAELFGPAGAAELHQQVVHILNFRDPPVEVLREQLAFNVKLAGTSAESNLAVASSVAWEASQLAGLENVVTVSLLQVPVFHGTSGAIWLEVKEDLDPKKLRSRFRSAPFETAKSSRGALPPSPVRIAGSATIHVGTFPGSQSGGPRGFWLWAVADTPAYEPSAAAIEIARSLLAGS
jgi:aspartate-semialdehyde dehydrogenase